MTYESNICFHFFFFFLFFSFLSFSFLFFSFLFFSFLFFSFLFFSFLFFSFLFFSFLSFIYLFIYLFLKTHKRRFETVSALAICSSLTRLRSSCARPSPTTKRSTTWSTTSKRRSSACATLRIATVT